MQNIPRYAGMVWYRRDDWEKLRAIFADSHVLPDTYDQWLQKAEDGYRRFKGGGTIVEKVYIDPETFPDWCRNRGLDIDANARTAFSSEMVRRKYIKTDG